MVVYFSFSTPCGWTPATKFPRQKDFLRRPLQLLFVKPRGGRGETQVHNHSKRFFDYFSLLVAVRFVLCIFWWRWRYPKVSPDSGLSFEHNYMVSGWMDNFQTGKIHSCWIKNQQIWPLSFCWFLSQQYCIVLVLKLTMDQKESPKSRDTLEYFQRRQKTRRACFTATRRKISLKNV